MSSAAKDAAAWRPLEGADAPALGRARLMAHHALQWLARFARAYVPPKPDDSHTSLLWDSGLDGFVSRTLADGSRLSLRLPDLSLGWHAGRNTAPGFSLALDRRRDGEALLWLGEIVAAHGLDGQALETEAPYEIPDHAVAHGAAYDVRGAAAGLAELARWFGNGNGVLGRAHRALVAHKLAAGPVSAWPHHFDLATLAAVPRSGGEDGSVGVGLSPGDEYYAEPYFYVSVYPEPAQAALPKLASVGHWHTHDFTAAIAPAHVIVAAKEQGRATWEFLEGAIDAAIGLVG
jgi:hypothetical protein